MEKQIYSRQVNNQRSRMTRKDVLEYVRWCFSDDIYTRLSGKSFTDIMFLYFESTGKRVSHAFVCDQYEKWKMIDNELYEKSGSNWVKVE